MGKSRLAADWTGAGIGSSGEVCGLCGWDGGQGKRRK